MAIVVAPSSCENPERQQPLSSGSALREIRFRNTKIIRRMASVGSRVARHKNHDARLGNADCCSSRPSRAATCGNHRLENRDEYRHDTRRRGRWPAAVCREGLACSKFESKASSPGVPCPRRVATCSHVPSKLKSLEAAASLLSHHGAHNQAHHFSGFAWAR